MIKKLAQLLLTTLLALSSVTAQQLPWYNSFLNVRLVINVSKTDSTFIYKYSINNEPNSPQPLEPLEGVRIEVGDSQEEDGGTLRNLVNLSSKNWQGWVDNVTALPRDPTAISQVLWSVSDSTRSVDDLYLPAQSSVNPGQAIEVSFQSRGLPSIKRFWAKGWVKPISERQLDSLHALGFADKDIFKPWYEELVQGITIAPQIPIGSFIPLTFLDTLTSYKHQAFALGWIKNQGIVQSLDAKLDNAKRQLQRNNTTAARNTLQAFVNEVEALWKDEEHPYGGKQITSEAYALLKFNAEYLVSKL